MESNYFPKAEMTTVKEIINYPLKNRGELDWYKKKLKDLRDLEGSVKGVPKKSESKDNSLYKMNIFKNVPPKYLDTDDWLVKRKKYIKNNLYDESIYVRNILPKCCDYKLPTTLNRSAAIRNLPKILEYKKYSGILPKMLENKKRKGNLPKNISANILDNINSKNIPRNELKKSYSTVKEDNFFVSIVKKFILTIIIITLFKIILIIMLIMKVMKIVKMLEIIIMKMLEIIIILIMLKIHQIIIIMIMLKKFLIITIMKTMMEIMMMKIINYFWTN